MEEKYGPRFSEVDGWEPCDAGVPGSQIVDLQWVGPKFGCDSLQMAVEGAADQERLCCAAVLRKLAEGYHDPATCAALLRAAKIIEKGE
ncbi:MAG: hypothetical protein U1E51_07095 [Candidatus Binatia bacterium]|nr:hypothetical protein [Candidatus Binatia bacterium]